MVTGNPGAGKTTLALQFLYEGAKHGESGIFIAFDQKPSHVIEAAAGFACPAGSGGAITTLAGSPAVSLLRQGQHAIDARAVMSDLIPHIRARAARRLVIDVVSALVPPGLSDAAETDFLRDLVFALEDNAGCTTLLVACDGDARAARISGTLARLVTGVIDLRSRESEGRLRRYALVTKMRASRSDPMEREFVIDRTGVVMVNQV